MTQQDQYGQEMQALGTVQRRVLSVGAASITLHGVIGLAWYGQHIYGQGRTVDAWIMVLLAMFTGVVTVVLVRVILGHSPFTPFWHLLVQLIPLGFIAAMLTGFSFTH